MFISITQFDGIWPQNTLVSEFTSKTDLIDAFAASASIPFFTANPLWSTFRGKAAIDGGFTNNTPIFHDKKNAQLVINLGYASYPLAYTIQPADANHETLVYEGMDDIVTLLSGEGRPPAVELIDSLTDGGECGGEEEKGREETCVETLEGGGEGSDSFLDNTHPFLENFQHFLRFDIVPWFMGGGLGIPFLISLSFASLFLWGIGVYGEGARLKV